MAVEPKKTLSASMKPLKNPKLGRRRKAINKKDMIATLRDYSSDSTIHGIQYLGDPEHSTCGKVFWILTVCTALTCTSFQVFNIWVQWIDDPVVTTLNTILRTTTKATSRKSIRTTSRTISSKTSKQP